MEIFFVPLFLPLRFPLDFLSSSFVADAPLIRVFVRVFRQLSQKTFIKIICLATQFCTFVIHFAGTIQASPKFLLREVNQHSVEKAKPIAFNPAIAPSIPLALDEFLVVYPSNFDTLLYRDRIVKIA
jgi:hypothetical protein